MMKRILSLVLVLLIILTLPVSAMAAEEDSIREAFETTGDYMTALGDPSAGSTGGEWMALGFARSGREVPDSYYDSVVAYVDEKIDENEPLADCIDCLTIVGEVKRGRFVARVDTDDRRVILKSIRGELVFLKRVLFVHHTRVASVPAEPPPERFR